MSDYVEARYALLTLQQAHESDENRATNLLNELLRDLGGTQGGAVKRANAIASIRHLAVVLCEHKAPPPSYWDDAYEAACAWREQAHF